MVVGFRFTYPTRYVPVKYPNPCTLVAIFLPVYYTWYDIFHVTLSLSVRRGLGYLAGTYPVGYINLIGGGGGDGDGG